MKDMAVFSTDRKKATANELIPAGEYEMYVKSLAYDVTQGGSERLALALVIRDDIEQDCTGRMMFDSMWLSEAALPYTERKLNQLCAACDIDDGREYASWDLLGMDLAGRFVRVKVGVSKAQNGYEPRNQANAFMRSKNPAALGEIKGLDEVLAKPKPAQESFSEVTEDLPF